MPSQDDAQQYSLSESEINNDLCIRCRRFEVEKTEEICMRCKKIIGVNSEKQTINEQM